MPPSLKINDLFLIENRPLWMETIYHIKNVSMWLIEKRKDTRICKGEISRILYIGSQYIYGFLCTRLIEKYHNFVWKGGGGMFYSLKSAQFPARKFLKSEQLQLNHFSNIYNKITLKDQITNFSRFFFSCIIPFNSIQTVFSIA